MSKVKIPRKSTLVDMTAMCDVAFLLLTFFMLTSNFTKKEPVVVNTPSSISEIKIPETDILMILVDSKGKIFVGIDGQESRKELLIKMGDLYHIKFTERELADYSLLNQVGVPISQMKAFLSLTADQRDLPENLVGIPCDSLDNQFKNWVTLSRLIKGKELRIAIKGDKATTYSAIKKVMNTLQEAGENRFNLITGLEKSEDFI